MFEQCEQCCLEIWQKRLIWTFAGCACPKVRFLTLRLVPHCNIEKMSKKSHNHRTNDYSLVSILHKSIAGRYRPVRVADGPMTARCRFTKNASSEGGGHQEENSANCDRQHIVYKPTKSKQPAPASPTRWSQCRTEPTKLVLPLMINYNRSSVTFASCDWWSERFLLSTNRKVLFSETYFSHLLFL